MNAPVRRYTTSPRSRSEIVVRPDLALTAMQAILGRIELEQQQELAACMSRALCIATLSPTI